MKIGIVRFFAVFCTQTIAFELQLKEAFLFVETNLCFFTLTDDPFG